MSTMSDSIVQYFSDNGVSLQKIADLPAFKATLSLEHATYQCRAIPVENERQQFVFYSLCPIKVPQQSRLAVSEFVTRANSGFIIGNFEMDFSDGEVRFKTSVDVTGSELTPPLIEPVVKGNLATMDAFIPKLLGVVYGGFSAGQALSDAKEQGGEARWRCN